MKSFVHPTSFFWKSEDAHCRKTATGVTAGTRNANVQGKSWAVCNKVCKAEGVGLSEVAGGRTIEKALGLGERYGTERR